MYDTIYRVNKMTGGLGKISVKPFSSLSDTFASLIDLNTKCWPPTNGSTGSE